MAFFGNGFGLGVIEDVVHSVMLDDARLVQTTLLPRSSIGIVRMQTRCVYCPMQQVLTPAKSNDCRANLIPRIRIRMPYAEILAVHLNRFAGREDVVLSQD